MNIPIEKYMDSNFSPCVVLNETQKILYVNSAAANSLGFLKEDLLGKTFSYEKISNVLKTRNGENNEVQFQFNAIAVDNYEIIFLQDDIYQVKSDLEKSFNALAGLVNFCAVYFLDKDGNILSFNEAARKIQGYNKEILNKNFSIFFEEKDIINGVPQSELKLAKENGYYEIAASRLKKDHTVFMAHISIISLYNLDGSIKGYLKLMEELTPSKIIEREVYHNNIMNVIESLDILNKKINSRLEN